MKTKKFSKKLSFSKSTIANLGMQEKSAVKGGYRYTVPDVTCYTWCAGVQCVTLWPTCTSCGEFCP